MKPKYFLIISLLLTVVTAAVSTGELIQTASTSFARLIYVIPGVILAIGLRGAFIAKKVIALGDHYSQRGTTWNPIPYLDPTGSLAGIFFTFGWPYHPEFDRRLFQNPMRDEWRLYISASGFNFFQASLALLLFLPLSFAQGHVPDFILSNTGYVIQMIAMVNLMVGFYSFLPLYPLPGYDLLFRFLSPVKRYHLDQKRSITMLVLMILLFLLNPILQIPLHGILRFLISINPLTLILLSLTLAYWLFLIELRVKPKE